MTGGEFIIRSRQLRALAMCDAFIAAIDKAKSIIHKETTMTNAEAIEVLESIEITAGARELREFGFMQSVKRVSDLSLAISKAKAALREKAERERRYVVHEDKAHGPYRVCDIGTHGHFYYPANYIPTREAAQQIADIYEGMKP